MLDGLLKLLASFSLSDINDIIMHLSRLHRDVEFLGFRFYVFLCFSSVSFPIGRVSSVTLSV